MPSSAPTAARRAGDVLRRRDEARCRVVWPTSEYEQEPVCFGREVLGVRRYWSEQREWLAQFAKRRAWMAVSTGQKTGKTEAYITAILHHFASRRAALFYLFAPKIEHTNVVLWPRFVKIAVAAYRPCASCKPRHDTWLAGLDDALRPPPCRACSPLIDPEWINETDASKGLRAPDGRRVMAYTANKLGALGGLSGEHIAFGTDESSDVDDPVYEAVVGNAMGGARFFGIGNPLYPYGWFARAFKDQKAIYSFTAMVSARMTPNCTGEEPPIPGLADLEGIQKAEEAWKGAAAIIAARIDGRFPEVREGQLIPLAVTTGAERRWLEGLNGDGPLQLGVDVAKGTARDKLTIAPARGRRIEEVQAHKPGNHATGAALVADAARSRRRPREIVRIVYDASGKEGRDFGREMRRYAGEFELYPIYATHPPRQRKLFDKIRDEIADHYASWLRTGAIPPDAELEAENEALTSKQVRITFGGVSWDVARVITNDEVERILHRHPDKRNACELAVWPVEVSDMNAEGPLAEEPRDGAQQDGAFPSFIDPYGGQIDPYGSPR